MQSCFINWYGWNGWQMCMSMKGIPQTWIQKQFGSEWAKWAKYICMQLNPFHSTLKLISLILTDYFLLVHPVLAIRHRTVRSRKSLELAAKYVTVLYRMPSSQSAQRMHHLQGHWFWKERIEPLGNTSIHMIFRSRLSSKWRTCAMDEPVQWANLCNGRIAMPLSHGWRQLII